MIGRAVNKLIDKLEETVSEWIATIFEWMFNLLGKALDTDGETAYAQFSAGGMIKATPFDFDSAMWNSVKGLSDNVIVPIAGLVLVVVLVNDLLQAIIGGNQFENVGLEVFFKWFVKGIIGIILVSNVFVIANWIFFLGSYAGEKGTDIITGNISSFSIVTDDYTLGQLLAILVIAIFVYIGICVLVVSIIVVLASRIIECFMYLAIAPIPMATYMNSEWRRIGDNWLRGVIALAFQGVFIVIALAIFKGLLIKVVSTMAANSGETEATAIFQMLILFAYTLALIMTVFRSGSISKTIFSAG